MSEPQVHPFAKQEAVKPSSEQSDSPQQDYTVEVLTSDEDVVRRQKELREVGRMLIIEPGGTRIINVEASFGLKVNTSDGVRRLLHEIDTYMSSSKDSLGEQDRKAALENAVFYYNLVTARLIELDITLNGGLSGEEVKKLLAPLGNEFLKHGFTRDAQGMMVLPDGKTTVVAENTKAFLLNEEQYNIIVRDIIEKVEVMDSMADPERAKHSVRIELSKLGFGSMISSQIDLSKITKSTLDKARQIQLEMLPALMIPALYDAPQKN